MVRMLSLTENLHTILRVLYDDMMALCYPISQVAMAIAGIGALLYIAYRVWQSLAQAEPIDLFPLMRPFAIGICILFFPTLVLGSLNGILSPLVKATHSLMAGQTLDMREWQERRERLELEGREQMPPDSYYAEDEEMERELSELGVDDQTQQTLDRMNEERSTTRARTSPYPCCGPPGNGTWRACSHCTEPTNNVTGSRRWYTCFPLRRICTQFSGCYTTI